MNTYKDLYELKKECDQIISGNRPNTPKTNFLQDIRILTKLYKDSSDPSIIETLIYCWTPFIRQTITKNSPAVIYVPDLDSYIELLLYEARVKERTRDMDIANLFACLCMVRVYIASKTDSLWKNHKVLELLENWREQNIDNSAVLNLKATVDCLYGTMCWELYSNDTKDHLRLPAYLYHNYLPLDSKFTISAANNTVPLTTELW